MPKKAANSRPGNGRGFLVLIFLLIMLLPFGYYAVRAAAVALGGGKPSGRFLDKPLTDSDECLWGMKAGEVRLHHWEELGRIREDVVRHGNRDVKGLNSCRSPECHPSKANFCDKCHHRAGMTPDCFDCHHYPE